MKKFLSQALFECVLLGSLALWQVWGYEGAGNVFVFAAWFCVVVALIFGLSEAGKKALQEKQMSESRKAYQAARNVIVVIWSAWLGFYFLAAMYTFAWLLVSSNRKEKVSA